MPSEDKLSLKQYTLPVLLLAACFLTYPTVLLFPSPSLSYGAVIILFGLPAISCLAAICCLADLPRQPAVQLSAYWPVALIGVIVLIEVARFSSIADLYWPDLFRVLALVIIPSYVALNAATFKTLIPWFMSLLWLFNAYQGIAQVIVHYQVIGLPGNRNWHACLLAVTTPFLIHLLVKQCRRWKLPQLWLWLSVILPAAISLSLFYYCQSRGGVLSLVLALACYLIISKRNAFRRQVLISASTVIVLVLLLGLFFATKQLRQAEAKDVRLPIWRGTIALASQHLLTGTGTSKFESGFAPFRPMDYFDRAHATIRTNHPHNHFLYILASLGIVGFACWFLLVIYPFAEMAFRKHRTAPDSTTKLCMFAALVLLIHGQLDLVLYEWPTNLVFLIFLGVLWNHVWCSAPCTKKQDEPLPLYRLLIRIPAGLAIVILVVALSVRVYSNFIGTKALRSAIAYAKIGKQTEQAAYFHDESLKFLDTPIAQYRALTNAYFHLGDPYLSLHYYSHSQAVPVDNFAHNKGIAANSLIQLQRFHQALPLLQQETANYPASVTSWYNLHNVQRLTGQDRQAQTSWKMIGMCLKRKGLDWQHLPLLLDNPEYDLHPQSIPPELKIDPNSSPGGRR